MSRRKELNLALLHALALHITGFLIVAYTWSHGILIARAGRPYWYVVHFLFFKKNFFFMFFPLIILTSGGMGAMMLLSSWTSDGAGYFSKFQII